MSSLEKFRSWFNSYEMRGQSIDDIARDAFLAGAASTRRGATAPAARSTHPETSHEAAASVRNISAWHERILAILLVHPEGLTHEQIRDEHLRMFSTIKCAESSIRSRCSELLHPDVNAIRWTGRYDKTAAGRRSRVWEAVL